MPLLLAVRPAGGKILLARGFGHLELLEQHRGIGEFEIVPRIFLLGLQEHVTIGNLLIVGAAVEVEVVDVVDALHIHREPLEAICELAGHRRRSEERRVGKECSSRWPSDRTMNAPSRVPQVLLRPRWYT